MNEANAFWSGPDGAAYTQRNRVNWRLRVPFWGEVLDMTGARSVYECGANSGWNLWAIKHAAPHVRAQGCEINQTACTQARNCGLDVMCGDIHNELCWRYDAFDLIYSAGVLIHVPPGDLQTVMLDMVRASADYVLAVEYAAPEEQEIEYRGQRGLLWKRPYGKLYQDLGLRLVREWDAGPGFDRCTATLLRKAA